MANFTFPDELKIKVKEQLLENKNLDVHQAILNISYNEYSAFVNEQNKERELKGYQSKYPWNYSELVGYTEENLGNLAAFAVSIGKLNEQVENGGFQQYWENGYASDDGKFKDIYIHSSIIEYFSQFKNEIYEYSNKIQLEELNDTLHQVENILQDFPELVRFTSTREYSYFNLEGEVETEEDDFGSPELTEDSIQGLSRLDIRYYKYNKQLMEILNQYFMNYLFNNDEQAELESIVKAQE